MFSAGIFDGISISHQINLYHSLVGGSGIWTHDQIASEIGAISLHPSVSNVIVYNTGDQCACIVVASISGNVTLSTLYHVCVYHHSNT